MKVPSHIMRNRPNRTAKGMTKTFYRGARHLDYHSEIANTLSVFGTLDSLRSGIRGYTTGKRCACCGARTKRMELNDLGKKRLAKKKIDYLKRIS